MKILHLIYDHVKNPWVGGGAALRAREIYRRLAQRHDITVVCGKYPGAKDYEEDGVRYRFAGIDMDNYVLSTFSYAWRATRYLRAHARGADIVIEDFAPYNPVFSFLWADSPVLQVHQREGSAHFRKYLLLGTPFYLAELYYHRFFKNVFVLSEEIKKNFRIKGNAMVVPNGFDPALLDETRRDSTHILFLGRLHINQKGLDTLDKAMCEVVGDAKLVIAGSGKDEEKTRRIFDTHIKSGRAEMVGYVTGPRKTMCLANCSFMVMPSRYEGQPLTAIEAAALGKPLVVSDIPELAYAVEAGFGLSFKSNDAKDLAEKMQYLLDNPSVRAEMGQRAKRYARDFTWDRIAERYERFLHETAGVDV